ncbi:MAG: hypothetical protein JWQ73_3235, partial [Variovorax sp.]|nr:hypothetical protein [Variovorax sp.]
RLNCHQMFLPVSRLGSLARKERRLVRWTPVPEAFHVLPIGGATAAAEQRLGLQHPVFIQPLNLGELLMRATDV